MSSHSSINEPNTPSSESLTAPAPWSPDCGDGTYKNPVLFADYSDPDAIRVGDDFWLTASSFCHVPGLPILHSRDLVNWTLVTHALKALEPAQHFSTPRHGGGVWAPTLRHHAGLFWIFFPDPDFGIQVITAKDPRGEWSAPKMLKAGKGLIDPCTLWDDDGRAYLIHGWAKSRSGICNLLTLHEMAPDGSRLLDEGKIVIDANKLPGWQTLEGPKFYKRKDWYYIFAPAGGVATGYQAVFRSKNVQGPYEPSIVLEQGPTPVNGPHQGAWVETQDGEHWFLHFQEMPAYGRVVHLQPMRWTDDDWVKMGAETEQDKPGVPVLRHKKPALPVQTPCVPVCSDVFAEGRPGPQWQWQCNPSPTWLRAPEMGRPGLSLACVPATGARTLDHAGNLLLQKFPAPAFFAETRLELLPSRKGDRAGLLVFGSDYCWLGLEWDGNRFLLVHRALAKGGEEGREHAFLEQPAETASVWLRVQVSQDALCRFSFSADGIRYQALESAFPARSGRWVGAKVGLFAAATAPDSKGLAQVSVFAVT